MGEDASIDEFATAVDEEAADGADGTDGTENTTAEPGNEGTDSTAVTNEHDAGVETESAFENVAPTVTIYGWVPRNATCEACGESAKRRWRDDGEMVCADCKEW